MVRRAVLIYVGACCGLAAVPAVVLVAGADGVDRRTLWLAPVLGLVLLIECARDVRFRHRGDQGQSITHDESFLVAGVFLIHPYGIVLALTLGLLLADVILRRPPVKILFNAAKSVGTVSLGLLVVEAIGDAGAPTTRGAVGAAAGGLLCVALSDVVVSGVVALSARERLVPILREDVSGRTLVWAGNISIGLLAGLTAARDLRMLPFALVAFVALHFALWGHARARRERDRSQERERLLQTILDSEPHCVTVVDRDGTIGFVNPAGVRMLGVSEAAAVIGVRWQALVAAKSRASLDGMFAVGFGGTVNGCEVVLERDGALSMLDSTIAPLADEYGDVVSLVVVTRDMTSQRELEGRLRQAQKLEAVGQLAGGIAHDFNNLLTAIGGYSELALAQLGPESAGARADIAEIRRASERAAGLTRQLLTFSRREVVDPTTFDLNAAILDIESLLRRVLGGHVEIVASLDPLSCPIVADQTQVDQVLMNLAINARDAMPDGGTLRIATDNVGNSVRLRITDTGVGMDATVQDRMFEPFFTTKEPGKGTGLGLAMVFGIVEESGGTISVDSAPDAGTTFTVTFPRAARSQRSGSSSTPPRAAASPRM
jgi:PAS domain S-box-containing protein